MAYRDDRQALELQVAELELDNEKLRRELEAVHSQMKDERARGRERQRTRARGICPACGGTLLPAAVFAGPNDRNPMALRMSTLRFGSPSGGFTHSAPVQAKVCGSCGFIHHYIDLGTEAAERVTQEMPAAEMIDDEPSAELTAEPDPNAPDDD